METTSTRPRQALLLAAGEGSRLRPLTERIPKPMLPIDGEAVITRVIRQVVAAGVDHVTIVIGHRGDDLRSFVEANFEGDVELAFVTQEERFGSGHALQLALNAGLVPTDTVVAASDTWWRDEDVSGLVEGATSDPDALLTMALLRWPVEQLPHSSAVVVDEQRRVSKVLHRIDPTGEPDGTTALSGSPLYVFGAAFWRYVEQLQPSASGMIELASGIQRAIDDGHFVRGHEVFEARDLTRPDDLLRHNFPYLVPWLDAAKSPS